MGLAIDLANGWLEGSLDRRPLRRGPMTAMDRTAAKMTVTREGSFVVVKLIDDIQERLVIEPAELLAPGPVEGGQTVTPCRHRSPSAASARRAIDKNTAELAELRNETRYIQDALMHRR